MGKITIKGKFGTATFENASDAAEFARELEGTGRRRRKRSASPEERSSRRGLRADRVKQTIKLIETVRDAGEKGVDSDTLAMLMERKGPRGLSSVGAATKADLGLIGMTFDDVIWIERTPDGNRWRAYDNAERALVQLRELIGAG